MDVTGSENRDDDAQRGHAAPSRKFRVEHRVAGNDPEILARIRNVFPHHDTLTQYVSRLLTERDADQLLGELVLVDEETDEVLARRDLRRACQDNRRGRQEPHRNG